jgi:acyl-coenzyme A synthetase/AMP-(fatty) acid ligase
MLVLLLRLEQNQEFTEVLKQEIIARNRRLPDFKRIGGYVMCGKDFPRTASMKIKRAELAEDVSKVLGRAAVVEL